MTTPRELTRAVIEAWVKETHGWFNCKEIDNELEILTTKGRGNRRVILHRLCEEGVIEHHPEKNGIFRFINGQAPMLEWQQADTENTLDVRWPFQLERWMKIYPKNIAIIAGSFNAGKTAFCFNVIALNQNKFPIVYFTSEMGAEEMKVRLSRFEIEKWNFEARERTSKFSQVIRPDAINIIDYLEVTDNFYLIAEELTDIFNKLKGGMALVALQKKQSTKTFQVDMGRGAEFSLEKPRLYLSLDPGKLKIVKAKNWAQEGVNPNGKIWTFKLLNGAKFMNIEEWQGGEQ